MDVLLVEEPPPPPPDEVELDPLDEVELVDDPPPPPPPPPPELLVELDVLLTEELPPLELLFEDPPPPPPPFSGIKTTSLSPETPGWEYFKIFAPSADKLLITSLLSGDNDLSAELFILSLW